MNMSQIPKMSKSSRSSSKNRKTLRVQIKQPTNLSHMLHGTGIFTYMTGWFYIWVILFGQMLGFIFQHHGSHMTKITPATTPRLDSAMILQRSTLDDSSELRIANPVSGNFCCASLFGSQIHCLFFLVNHSTGCVFWIQIVFNIPVDASYLHGFSILGPWIANVVQLYNIYIYRTSMPHIPKFPTLIG